MNTHCGSSLSANAAVVMAQPTRPTSCRLLAGTLFVMVRGAGLRSLFLLSFVEPGLSSETTFFFYSVFRGQAASG